MRKVAVVTGGGRGIGAATTKRLAQDGYAIALSYANDAASAEAIAETLRASGTEIIAVRADVSVERDVMALFDRVDKEWGPLTLLVNNGGITGGMARVDDVKESVLSQVFSVNVIGAFLCCREAVRRMSTQHGGSGGSIVNVSSRAAELGGSHEWVHYAATKGALDTLTKGLAKEVALEGIRVNAVAPGLIETDIHAAAGQFDRVERMASTIPVGRAGQPEEVAECIAWLASPAASYVTGTIVAASGGR
ncbi:SDR family oxidoreductase [Robbsia sp. KACC 23696]|uniref:SDR family oxidoreductase n=1 Tax=Robbsia sp. KACC 23696 TaxID=3149231 RepID=UPI00325BAEF7